MKTRKNLIADVSAVALAFLMIALFGINAQAAHSAPANVDSPAIENVVGDFASNLDDEKKGCCSKSKATKAKAECTKAKAECSKKKAECKEEKSESKAENKSEEPENVSENEKK